MRIFKKLLKITLGLTGLGVTVWLAIGLMGGAYEKALIARDNHNKSKPTGAGEA